MNAIQVQTAAIRNQQALCRHWHAATGKCSVWAVFSDRFGLLSWAESKSNARKIMNAYSEEMGEFLWLVKIAA